MAEPTYHNFDLFFQREGDSYRVRADSVEGQAGNTFALPFSDMELENFLLTTRPGGRGVRRIDAPDVAAAKKFGGNLFEAVFSGDVQGCWRTSFSAASQEGTRLRVRLRFIDTPELADLPWEYLFSKSLNRFLALDDELAIVRYLDMPERTRPVSVTLPLRVLVMISNPADFPRLDVEQEWAQMQEGLAPLQERGLVSIDLLEDATLPALRKKLQANSYHILHFIGHGAFDRQTQEGVVVLKDENERGRLVSGQHLGWLLHNFRTLALVIINACEGARADRTDAFAGTAQSLVQQGIPAAVAMQFEITDGAAKTFSHAFYTAVADARPVENALFEARMAIFAEGHELEWATPVLYMRSANGHLFDIMPGVTLPKPEPVVLPEAAKVEEPVAEVMEVESPARLVPEAAPVVEPAPVAGPSPEDVEAARVAALYAQAQDAAGAGKMEEAATKAKEVLESDPSHAGAAGLLRYALEQQDLARLYGEGQAHLQAGRWAEAITALSQVRDVAPGYKDVDALIATAEARSAEANKQTLRGEASAMTAATTAGGQGQAGVPPPPGQTAKRGSTAGGLPMGVKIGAGAALVAVVLLVVLVVVVGPRLSGSNSAGPTETPESSAFVGGPVTEAATETPELGVAAESTPEGTAAEGGAGVAGFAGTIKIGLTAPLSGAEQAVGSALRNGAQLAVDDVMDRGGITIGDKTYAVELASVDENVNGEYDPAKPAIIAEEFVTETEFVAAIGPINVGITAAQMPVFNNASMAQMGVGTNKPELTKPEYGQTQSLRPSGKVTYFRVSENGDVQGVALADYMVASSSTTATPKIFVLDDGEAYGKSLADAVEKEFKNKGGKVLGRYSTQENTYDFGPYIKEMKSAGAVDAIFFGGLATENLGIARKQMVEAGLDVPFVGGDGMYSDYFIRDAGDAAVGSFVSNLAPDLNQLESAKTFLDEYGSKYGDTDKEYRLYSAQGYDAAGIIIDAIKKAQSTDREAVRATIAAMQSYPGVLGTTGFDKNGDTTNNWLSIYQVEDGKWSFADQFTYDK